MLIISFSSLQMSSLEALLSGNGDTSKAVQFKVIAISPTRSFTDKNKRTMELATAGIAHGNFAGKASVYGTHLQTTLPGRSFMARNYTVYNRTLVLKETARLFRCGNVQVAASAESTAETIVLPPSTVMTLRDIQQQNVNHLVTVTATVHSVSTIHLTTKYTVFFKLLGNCLISLYFTASNVCNRVKPAQFIKYLEIFPPDPLRISWKNSHTMLQPFIRCTPNFKSISQYFVTES